MTNTGSPSALAGSKIGSRATGVRSFPLLRELAAFQYWLPSCRAVVTLCLAAMLAGASIASADPLPVPIELPLSLGLNIVSVPIRPEATRAFDAAGLLEATGADWVVRLPSGPETLATTAPPRFIPYFSGYGLPAFAIRGDESYLLHVSAQRTWVLTGLSWPEFTLAGQLARTLGSVGVPAQGVQPDASDLLRLTGASGALTTEGGRFRFLSLSSGDSSTGLGWWVVRPAEGTYLLPRRDALDETPQLVLPAEVFAAPRQLIELTAVASDREWGLLSYSWRRTAGVAALLSASQTLSASFCARTAGDYAVECSASDSSGNTTAATTVVRVRDECAPLRLSVRVEGFSTSPVFSVEVAATVEMQPGSPLSDGIELTWAANVGRLAAARTQTSSGVSHTTLELSSLPPWRLRDGAVVAIAASVGASRATTAVFIQQPGAKQPPSIRSEADTRRTASADPTDTDDDGLLDTWETLLGTNPVLSDSDADGISDLEELALGLDPTAPGPAVTDGSDGDVDGLTDEAEVAAGTDPLSRDTDGDGAVDGIEVRRGLLPLKADTDGDGLRDGAEIHETNTDPFEPDSDGDGLLDGCEARFHCDPWQRDSDGDGLDDGIEVELGLNPELFSSDEDGVSDQSERILGTDPLARDTDGDGLDDGEEIQAGISALSRDTDGDGLDDRMERTTEPNSDANIADTDGDGLSDADERRLGLRPRDRDYDGDGISDGEEIRLGLSPTEADHDGDTRTDAQEDTTNPFDPDSDGDGLRDNADFWSGVGSNLGACVPDTDADGLLDRLESTVGPPLRGNPDSDADGLPDGLEVALGFNPGSIDTDLDGRPDGLEAVVPSTGTLALVSLSRVVGGGARVGLQDGRDLLSSDLGLEVSVSNTLGNPALGRLRFTLDKARDSGPVEAHGRDYLVNGRLLGIPQGNSKFFLSTAYCPAGTLTVDLLALGEAGPRASRQLTVRRVLGLTDIIRRTAAGEFVSVYNAADGRCVEPVRVGDVDVTFRTINLNPHEVGLRLRVASEAAGLLTTSTGMAPWRASPTELIFRVAARAAPHFTVHLNRARDWAHLPATVPVSVDLVSLTDGATVLWPPPEDGQGPVQLMVATRPSERMKVVIEYSGPVSIGGMAPGQSVPKIAKTARVTGKDEPVSVELQSAALHRDLRPRCRVEVKDEYSRSLTDVPIRFVTRRSSSLDAEPLEFRLDTGLTRDGAALTGSTGQVVGRLRYSGDAARDQARMLEVVAFLGAAADRPLEVLQAIASQEGQPVTSCVFTGRSVRFEANDVKDGQVRFRVPAVPALELAWLLDAFTQTVDEPDEQSLGVPQRPRLIRDLVMPAARPPAAGLRAIGETPADPVFGDKAVTAGCLAAEVMFGLAFPIASDLKDVVTVFYFDAWAKGESVDKVDALLALGMLALDLTPAGYVTRVGTKSCATIADVSRAIWRHLAQMPDKQLLKRILRSREGAEQVAEASKDLVQLAQNRIRISAGEETLEAASGSARKAAAVGRDVARHVERLKVLALQVLESRGLSAELADEATMQVLRVEEALRIGVGDDDAAGLMAFVVRRAQDTSTQVTKEALDLAASSAIRFRQSMLARVRGPRGQRLPDWLIRGNDVEAAADLLSLEVFKLARDATEADGVALAATAKALSDEALEALASIVAHPELVSTTNQLRGIQMARDICRSVVYRGDGLVNDLLAALNAPTALEGLTFVELPGAVKYLGLLGSTDNLGHAYAAVVAAKQYPGQAVAIGRKIGASDLDLVLRDTVIEVKYRDALETDIVGQLQTLSKSLDDSELSRHERVLLVKPTTKIDPQALEPAVGKPGQQVVKGTRYLVVQGPEW